MFHARQDLAFGCSIALQFIGNDHARDVLQPFEELTEEFFGRVLVASALHQDIEHIAVLINSSPQIVGFAVDFQINLVHMPCVSRFRTATAQLVGRHLPKFQARTLAPCAYVTTTPRWARSSSTSRKLREKRKYNHTVWLIISGGKRKPL